MGYIKPFLFKQSERSDAGFTLLEVMASVVILGIFAAGTTALLGNMVVESHVTQQRDEALVIAKRFVNAYMDAGGLESALPQSFSPEEVSGQQDTFHISSSQLNNPPIGNTSTQNTSQNFTYLVHVTATNPQLAFSSGPDVYHGNSGSSGQNVTIGLTRIEVNVSWQTVNQGQISPYTVSLEELSALDNSN